MRRTTPGNVDTSQLLPERIRRAESHVARDVIRKLEPLVLERRSERMREVIGRRLDSVTVVFDSPYDPHNGAAIIRSCEAFGVQRLHVIERTPQCSRQPFRLDGQWTARRAQHGQPRRESASQGNELGLGARLAGAGLIALSAQ